MRKKILLLGGMLAALTACGPVGQMPPPSAAVQNAAVKQPPRLGPRVAQRNFQTVVSRVEPVAEAVCRAYTKGRRDCALQIYVDDRPGQGPNAYQTVDKQGRPVIIFTGALIADARNPDEIAFVLGHEAAHHIAGHLNRKQTSAIVGSVLGAVLGAAAGAGESTIGQMQQIGADIGGLSYSKNYELEADALGAEITYRAGYDPVKGAGFFTRLPDPGDRFLGSHPANSRRISQVAQITAELKTRIPR